MPLKTLNEYEDQLHMPCWHCITPFLAKYRMIQLMSKRAGFIILSVLLIAAVIGIYIYQYHGKPTMLVTMYGWVDNDPPGNSIAHPRAQNPTTSHSVASGSGTFDDPLTMASDPIEWVPGTRMYIPYLKKYVIMEDDCEQCIKDWRQKHQLHIDIWMSSGNRYKDELLGCEDKWTRQSAKVEVNPPPDRPVLAEPLFEPATGTCL